MSRSEGIRTLLIALMRSVSTLWSLRLRRPELNRRSLAYEAWLGPSLPASIFYFCYTDNMNRESFWFPPTEDDLDKPFGLIEEAGRDLEAAIRALAKLADGVKKFPAVGPDASKTKLLNLIGGHVHGLKERQGELDKMVKARRAFAYLVKDAFHNPLQNKDQMGMDDAMQPVMAYTYKR